MAKQPARSHKSKKEQRAMAKKSAVKIVGNGFVQRSAKPKVEGDKKRSQLIRVSADFAGWLRQQAKVHGTVTNVTRRLYEHRAILSPMIEVKPGEIEQ
jgi:hypothetical protein